MSPFDDADSHPTSPPWYRETRCSEFAKDSEPNPFTTGKAVASANGYDAGTMASLRIYSHTWYHVTRRGGHVIPHSHPMASWSGVYCVDDGADPSAPSDSGLLRFHNPHGYSNTFLDPGNARMQAPYHHGFWLQRLVPGMLVLFPSWVVHDVTPYQGSGTRITVAFNCWFGQT